MGRREALALARVGFAVLTLVAIACQLSVSAGTGRLDIVNFFSYVTVLSNVFAAAVLLIMAARSLHYASVAVTVGAILAFGAVLCVVVAWLGDALRSRRFVPLPEA